MTECLVDISSYYPNKLCNTSKIDIIGYVQTKLACFVFLSLRYLGRSRGGVRKIMLLVVKGHVILQRGSEN